MATRGDRDPGLRVFRLDLQQAPRGLLGLLPARPSASAPARARATRAACARLCLQRMAQQALGIARPCRRSARRPPARHSAATWLGSSLQDCRKSLLGRACDRRPPAPRWPPRCVPAPDRSTRARSKAMRASAYCSRSTSSVAVGQPGAVVVRHASRAPAAPPRAPAPRARRAGRRAPGPRARRRSPGALAQARSSVARLSSILSWSRSATPSSHRQLSSSGACAASARSHRSAVAARPARSAACACRRAS